MPSGTSGTKGHVRIKATVCLERGVVWRASDRGHVMGVLKSKLGVGGSGEAEPGAAPAEAVLILFFRLYAACDSGCWRVPVVCRLAAQRSNNLSQDRIVLPRRIERRPGACIGCKN
ncbi:hypothetical protein GGTG_11922 [Gaeumannomyces tritici R3-111a-1]|uniref:Uncharacterized protein n=1 Tax=Gaeumannomyces tritici (strain R3-111a-1) TaxID=644352 RepID=J3PEJ1_GAET3|nr:hypothetical protein GGTG_11922 [Gaeumannomyces tritici R3-111a-1]EJT70899.1 hypothetical protein GGTG_11922 [Gaeumannomyces tritici R3-111a-1]